MKFATKCKFIPPRREEYSERKSLNYKPNYKEGER